MRPGSDIAVVPTREYLKNEQTVRTEFNPTRVHVCVLH